MKIKRIYLFLLSLILLFTSVGFVNIFAEPSESSTTSEINSDIDEDPIDYDDDDEENEKIVVRMGIVRGTGSAGINIRCLPSSNATTVTGLSEKTKLIILSRYGNWYKVAYYGFVGYASAEYIIPYSYSADVCEFGSGTITGSSVYLRTEPVINENNKICILKEGNTVRILGVGGGWYYVDYNNKVGYVSADYLFPIQDEKVNFSKAKVNTLNGVNMRASTSADSELIIQLNYATEVTVQFVINGWYKVKYTANSKTYTGFIKEDYLINSANFKDVRVPAKPKTPKTTTEANKIIATAKKYLGYRYVWGGTTPKTGFDCSGFTQYVFAQCGYKLNYRTQQYKNGKAVSFSNLMPGDLVFFDTNQNGTIGHVGIYIGNGNFIHAANPKSGVIISTLKSGYYYKNYVCARRILK